MGGRGRRSGRLRVDVDPRKGSLLNFVDYGLATAALGLVHDFLWRGERRIPVRWIRVGPVSLAPSLRYDLTPVGPERRVRSRYKVGAAVGQVYVRWTESTAPGRPGLVGGGGEYQGVRLGRLEPKLSLDLWRNPDRSTGARGELSATFSRSPDDRLLLSLALGAKSPGYLLGFPLRAGAYVNAGAGLRF